MFGQGGKDSEDLRDKIYKMVVVQDFIGSPETSVAEAKLKLKLMMM